MKLEDFVNLKRGRLAIIIVLALGITASLYFVLTVRSRQQRIDQFNRAYEAIKVGDSRDTVVAALGKPHTITNCPSYNGLPKMDTEFQAKCFQEFEYVSFMARHTIYFDRNGVVIHKTIAVSP